MLKNVIVGTIAGTLTSMGIGGGGILIPILYLFNFSQREAQLVNLLYYIPIAILATIINSKNQLVNYKITIRIILYGIVGAIVGAYVSQKIDKDILKNIFGGLMIILGVYQLITKRT